MRVNIERKTAMYIAKKVFDYGLKEIAASFGLTHYGTVAYAISTLSSILAKYPELNLKLHAIIKRLIP